MKRGKRVLDSSRRCHLVDHMIDTEYGRSADKVFTCIVEARKAHIIGAIPRWVRQLRVRGRLW